MFRTAALGLLLVGCNAVYGLGETSPVNTNPRRIEFDNSAATRDLVDFPVLLELDATRIEYGEVAEPATDLRFEKDGVDLAFEVERWDPAGTSIVWVKVPRIAAASTTDHMLMHYGTTAGGQPNPRGTWSTYELVVHGQPGDFTSPTGLYTGTQRGIGAAEGKIAGAMTFGGTGDHYLAFETGPALFDRWQQFTFEMWIYLDYDSGNLPTGGEPRVLDMAGAFHLGRLIPIANINFLYALQIDGAFDAGPSFLGTYLPFRLWTHVVYTYDGQTQWVYRNGVFADVQRFASPSQMAASQMPFAFGNINNAGFDGMLDEIRISKTYRDPDWVNAEFLGFTGRFVSFVSVGDAR